MSEHLALKVEGEFGIWQRDSLQPFVASRLESLMRELDARAKSFVSRVENLRFDLVAGESVSKESIKYEQAKVSLLERILAAAGGYLFGDIATGVLGAVFGFEEMLKSLIPQMTVLTATIVFVGFNPFVLLPAMAISGIVQGIWKALGGGCHW